MTRNLYTKQKVVLDRHFKNVRIADYATLDYYKKHCKEFAEFIARPRLLKKYQYLLVATSPKKYIRDVSLECLILSCIDTSWESLFIVHNDKVLGFMCYDQRSTGHGRIYACDITFFSCSQNGNGYILMKTAKRILDTLRQAYSFVMWESFRDNPFSKAYASIIEKEGGVKKEVKLKKKFKKMDVYYLI